MLFRNAVPVQRVEGEGTKLPKIKSLLVDKFAPDPIVESLAEVDEDILNAFLSDRRFPTIEVLRELSRLTAARKIVPIYFGAAAQGLGVPELLDGICQILPPPRGNSDADLSALTFKIESKSALGRISHVRIFNGSIKHGTTVHNCTSGKDEKPTRILKLQPGQGYVPVSGLEAGDIGLLCGLKHTSIGHILGGDDAVPALANQVEPLLTARIVPEVEAGWGELLEALRELEDEEPLLNVEWLEEQREINVRFFGEVQMEIVLGLLLSRFNIRAQFSKPRIIYKETPKKSSKARVELRTHGFADIEIQIEPLPPGSGFQYEHAVRADKVYYKFMKQIPNLLDEARRHGPQGWEVTDFKATLLDGDSRYDMGTTYADFKIVTPQVLGKALKLAGTHLLEPIMTFEINVPEIYRSDIFRDLVKMRAQFTDPAPQHGRLTFSGTVPFVEIFEHTATLYASSHGQGAITTAFAGYRELNASGGR